MSDLYLTIDALSEGLYKEKGSKFLGFALPVQTEKEVDEHLKWYRKKYYDSRHVCYAFALGKDGLHYRASDGGEPSNSAGAPILGQIRSNNLTNILVIVVRYFGGTKLGVPGLIHAYKSAAEDAIHQTTIIEEYEKHIFTISFGYPVMNDVMRVIKNLALEVVETQQEISCTYKIATPLSKSKEAQETFLKIRGVEIKK